MSTETLEPSPRISREQRAHRAGVAKPVALEELMRQKDALFRLTDRLQRAQSIDEVYDASLDAILSALPCDRASILLFDEAHAMRFVAWRDLSEPYRKTVEGKSPWSTEEDDPTPICIDDIDKADLDPRLKAAIRDEGIRAIGFFPLIASGRLIGKFMTYSNSPHVYSSDEVEFSLTIARQLAFAIERCSADQALRAKEQRLRAELADTQLLQRISAELLDERNVNALYEKLVDAAMAIMRSDFGSMQVLHPQPAELQVLAARGFTPQARQFWERVNANSGSACAAALRSQQRVIVSDVIGSEIVGPADRETYLQTGIRAVQSTPLLTRSGRMVGVISTHWREPHSPSERSLRLLDILARQAADLIERLRAAEELNAVKDRLATEVEDLKRLHAFSARLMHHTEVGAVLHDLLLAATDLMPGRMGTVQLYDGRTDVLRLISTVGLPRSLAEVFNRIDSQGITTCAAALRAERRIVVPDLWVDPQFQRFAQVVRAYHIRSAQSTPLLDETGAVAGIVTTYCDEPCEPTERQMRLLDLYAEVAVRQLERKRSEENLAFLAELSAAFAPIGSMKDIARITSERIRKYFGAAGVSFAHVNTDADVASVFHSERNPALTGASATQRISDYLGPETIAELSAGRIVAINDVITDPRTASWLASYAQWDVRALVLAPHISNGRWKSTLTIYKTTPYKWRAKDLELLEEIAARVHIRLERARAEEALAESEAKLREDDRRKDEFLAMLAHELRNPLAPIVNAVHLLGRSKVSDPTLQRVRDIIDRQAARLARLVDDLLEVSRITSGRIQLHLERVSLGSAIDRAIETVRPLIEQRRHALQLSLPEHPVWLHADPARLEQIVVNLLNNAAKYTDDGGTIQMRVHIEDHFAVLKIIDNGIGIEPDLQPRIFDLFTQAERSLDRSSGGLGIGLSLVQRLVAMHGGTVSVQSAVGQGSEFTVRLPLAVEDESRSDEGDGSVEHPARRTLRILVVDDNVDAAQSFAMLLEASGHKVEVAHDGFEALSAADDLEPQVVFLDIGLPKLNGYEVARRLREHPAHRRATLVAMTGYGQSSDRELAQAAGFDHHLVKPAYYASVEPILAAVGRTPSRG
jgi:signal transduction histidine kinase/ActR/RegA family two-component response regulator